MNETTTIHADQESILAQPLELLVLSDVFLECLDPSLARAEGDGLLYAQVSDKGRVWHQIGPRSGTLPGYHSAGFIYSTDGQKTDPYVARPDERWTPASYLLHSLVPARRKSAERDGQVYFTLGFSYGEGARWGVPTKIELHLHRGTLLGEDKGYQFVSYDALRTGAKELLRRSRLHPGQR